MEIRTTDPELEELISILAENNVTEALQRFAYQWHQILPEDPNDDIPFISIEQDTQHRFDYIETESLTYPSRDQIVRVVGVQKSQDLLAAAFLISDRARHPNPKMAALQTAYWVRQYVILYGIRKGYTLDEISEMVKKTCALQVKYLRTEIRRNRATKYLPKELRKRKNARPPEDC